MVAIIVCSVVALAAVIAAYDIARRYLAGVRVEVDRQPPDQSLTDRVEMHELALKNALVQIREQFSALDGRWAELETRLKSDVSGTIAAATDGFGGTNWRQHS